MTKVLKKLAKKEKIWYNIDVRIKNLHRTLKIEQNKTAQRSRLFHYLQGKNFLKKLGQTPLDKNI